MSDLPRPEHAVSTVDRLRRRIDTAYDQLRLRMRRQRPVPEDGGLNISAVEPRPVASMIPGVLAGAACVLIGLGGVWAWQTWSNRVSEPIDDRLPFLLAADLADQPSDAPAETGPSGHDPALVEQPSAGLVVPATAPALTQGSSEPSAAAETLSIVVHVAGAVTRPGVVELGAGARVVDALQAVGGATPTADLDRVNLAALIGDGERIHVPAIGEDAVPIVVPTSGGVTVAPAFPTDQPLMLDINTASAAALEELPGVGPSTAAAIVRTRERRGPFLAVDELLEVPGIGEAKLSQIEPFVLAGR